VDPKAKSLIINRVLVYQLVALVPEVKLEASWFEYFVVGFSDNGIEDADTLKSIKGILA